MVGAVGLRILHIAHVLEWTDSEADHIQIFCEYIERRTNGAVKCNEVIKGNAL